ncbi:MAG: hotdog domain-containing protein [Thiohalobacteraceae bacterium]
MYADPIVASGGFVAHVGPIERLGSRAFGLVLEPHHLNFAGRFHGGMMLTLVRTACGEVARDEALRARSGVMAELLSLDCSFVSAALEGAQVRAEVDITRLTRTVAFLSTRVHAGDQVLATASSSFKIGVRQGGAPGPAGPEEPTTEGWSPMVTREPFAQRVAPVHERQDGAATKRAGFRVTPDRLDAHGRGVLHEGMSLFVADVFCGRAAVAASGSHCVTLGMQARRFGDAPAGSWVEFEPRVRHVAPSVVFVDGSFTVQDRIWLEVSSVWKVLGAT